MFTNFSGVKSFFCRIDPLIVKYKYLNFNSFATGLYNMLMTSAPPVAIGLFDQNCNAQTRMDNPKLYKTSQNSEFFNLKVWLAMTRRFSEFKLVQFQKYSNCNICPNSNNGNIIIGNLSLLRKIELRIFGLFQFFYFEIAKFVILCC